jgi:ribosomal protein L40E
MIKCIKCSAELADGAKFCDECGEKINHTAFCAECGSQISSDKKFCEKCGTPVEDNAMKSPAPKPNLSTREIQSLAGKINLKSKNTKIIIAAVAIVFASIFIINANRDSPDINDYSQDSIVYEDGRIYIDAELPDRKVDTVSYGSEEDKEAIKKAVHKKYEDALARNSNYVGTITISFESSSSAIVSFRLNRGGGSYSDMNMRAVKENGTWRLSS